MKNKWALISIQCCHDRVSERTFWPPHLFQNVRVETQNVRPIYTVPSARMVKHEKIISDIYG